MNNTPIEFASPDDENNNNDSNPWQQPTRSSYQDLILKPEYEARRLRLPLGQTWLRILPAFERSACGWLLPIQALNFEGGRFAHPKTLRRNAKSVFDHSYAWVREHNPESLYSKTNKTGTRLLSDPLCVFWALLEEEQQTVARLFVCSGYDGSRGGAAGLGFQFWSLNRERDETGALIGDVVHPDTGVLIRVEKTQAKGAKYPNYALLRGRQPAPMQEQIAKMESAEVRALCPLDEVVRELSAEEQWHCLEKVIAPATVAEIRSSLKADQ
ncbi:hypothetical protein BH09VER1_BH09VER1_17760 [soil metagenome]